MPIQTMLHGAVLNRLPKKVPTEIDKIGVNLTFVLCPQYVDLETEEMNPESICVAFDGLMDELNGMSLAISDICHRPYSGNICLSVDAVNSTDMEKMIGLSEWAQLEGDSIALRVHAVFDEPQNILAHHEAASRSLTQNSLERHCFNITEMLIKKLFVLMTVYLPGSSDCKYVYPTFERADFPHLVCRSSFQLTATALSSAGIKLTPNLSFSQFLNWSKKLTGFWIGEPDKPLSRCLNFLTYVHHQIFQLNTLSDFSWIMAALEAILTENSSEVKAKMVRRTLLLAPEIRELVGLRQIGKIYDFRSRFIHGDLKIGSHFYDDFEFEWPGKEFSENFSLVSAILFKCLHRIAEEGWVNLTFEDSVTGSH